MSLELNKERSHHPTVKRKKLPAKGKNSCQDHEMKKSLVCWRNKRTCVLDWNKMSQGRVTGNKVIGWAWMALGNRLGPREPFWNLPMDEPS